MLESAIVNGMLRASASHDVATTAKNTMVRQEE